ncbi:hypothetical protein AGABI2DRAFT_146090 [Agaricus bisporus var. bisporus H97]|uniref:hypothetical protein n=1 Tax=Agaricus bisporus var. bisporus (strain H97 / ATCC MYA-4626 / FGSC 10389) TaxID=936046 RepID=UPI00029F7827|nr:hypothetical protein AGABI2DRAFT_146090 [Agaricus bisporus var. bisporus H97]EKV43185.1 hypothetical protein AGABI2DRAFT_146090 [Agaricus bisporus var. bisporus H97]
MLSDAGSLGDSQSVVPLSDIDQCLLIYPGLDQPQQAAAMLLGWHTTTHNQIAIVQSPSPTEAPIKSSERVLQDDTLCFKILSLQRVDVNYGGGVILCASRFNTVTPRCAAAGLERAADCCSWFENKSSVISLKCLKTICAARCAVAGLEGAADCCSWSESISCTLSGDAHRILNFGKTLIEHPKFSIKFSKVSDATYRKDP